MPTPYFTLVREMKNAYNHRLRLVAHARQHGIKLTARLFQTTVLTVRKWLHRYQQQGPRGLLELSRAPQHQPRKTPDDIEPQVVALRQQLFTFGARHLIREFDLSLSHRALLSVFLLITAAMTYDRSTREIQSAFIDRYSKHLRAICANNIKFTIGTFTNESFAGWLNFSWGFSRHDYSWGPKLAQHRQPNT